MLRTRHLAGAITVALLFSAGASANQFSNVIVFGDSLSDNGNVSLAQGAPAPTRFTTNPGLTTAEHVANGLGFELTPSVTGGTDYAWGGAGFVNNVAAVPTITQQLQTYLASTGGKADGNALYQVWGGANDVFYLSTALTDQNAIAAGTTQAAQTELGVLSGLKDAGARYVVVYNLPDLGKTPQAAAGGAAAQTGASQLAAIYNSVLDSGLAQLSNNGLNVIPANTYALLNEIIADPGAYGFDNVTAPACSGSSVQCGPEGSGLPATYAPGTEQTYLFADGVHPTSAAHAMLGQYVLSVINAPSQISLLGEAPLASTAAQSRAIRKQMLIDGNGGETRAFVNIDYARQRFESQAGGSPRTNSDNANFTLGADVRATEHLSAGVALGVGQSMANFAGGTGGYKLQDITGLGYLTYHNGGGYVGGYANFGQANFKDIRRHIQIGAMRRTETGKADGSHLGGGITGGWWFDFNSIRTGPFATLEWQTAKVNGYSENGNDSTAMWFGSQQRDSLVATLGWRLQGHWDVGNTVLSPYAEIAWNRDDKADPRSAQAGLNSMNGSFALTGFTPDKKWGTADIGLSTQLTSNISSWIGYSGRFGDDSQKYNSFNMGFMVKF